MEYTKIVESIDSYLENETDYAIMIRGEWGVGKTYFLKSKVFPIIREKGKRSIYVSLIGLDEEAQLEKLVFEKINPFHFSKKKSHYSNEADHIESIINNTQKPELNIPENLVLCFDDLERINQHFFEAAIGYINLFIEHYKTKCIFLCNENVITKENRFTNYKSIKEKYIRFTFAFRSDLENIIETKIKEMELENSGFDQTSVILNVFAKGNTSNIRILFFVLSIYKQVSGEVNKITTDMNHKNQILKLILAYSCFYAIESRQGVAYSLLDNITIKNSQDLWNGLSDDTVALENNDVGLPEENPIPEKVDSERLVLIQNKYFNDNSFQFERFESVAVLINSGYLDTKLLESEVISLDKVLDETELIEENKRALKIINSIWSLSDSEIEVKVKYIADEAEKGKFDLQTYLSLYRELVWLESFKIKGLTITDGITSKFKDGAKKAVKSGKLRFIHNLLFQSQWDKKEENEFSMKFNSFASFIDTLNDEVNDTNEVHNFELVLQTLKSNNHDQLFLLSNKESDLRLTEENATQIYKALDKADAETTKHFYEAMNERYDNYGSTISEMPKKEKKFVLKLFNLLQTDENLDQGTEKPLSRVPLIFLRQSLKELIKYHFPEIQS